MKYTPLLCAGYNLIKVVAEIEKAVHLDLVLIYLSSWVVRHGKSNRIAPFQQTRHDGGIELGESTNPNTTRSDVTWWSRLFPGPIYYVFLLSFSTVWQDLSGMPDSVTFVQTPGKLLFAPVSAPNS
jgi:hypothetical protein